MKHLKTVGLFVGGLLIGVVAGGWFEASRSAITVVRPPSVRPDLGMAIDAAQEAQWAAELRRGESKRALAGMEKEMNTRLTRVALWNAVAPPGERLRGARDQSLSIVKGYQESYSASCAGSTRIKALLATVPARDPLGSCKSGVRSDDLRAEKCADQGK